MDTAATIVLNPDGSYADASAAALDLLGVTLEELLESQPGRFSAETADPPAETAFREQWESSGQPDLAGSGTIRRGDGQLLRIAFLIRRQADGAYLALLRPTAEPVAKATQLFTLGEVLAQWRAAERRMAEISPDHADWKAVADEVATLRDQYHVLYDRRRSAPGR